MPDFIVKMHAMAVVRGSLQVTADNASQAEEEALDRQGDVSWNYDGADDVEVESVEEVKE